MAVFPDQLCPSKHGYFEAKDDSHLAWWPPNPNAISYSNSSSSIHLPLSLQCFQEWLNFQLHWPELNMKEIFLASLCALPMLGGAHTISLEERADSLRDAAMARYEAGDRYVALELNRRAPKVSQHLPETGWRTIENYDDAGLYYYGETKWKASAQNQAIAVLLSCGIPHSASMFPTYLQRLGFAFARYRPQRNFETIAANPLVLLMDVRLNVRKNADLRRRYFSTHKVRDSKPGAAQRYVYVLRPESIPSSCWVVRPTDRYEENNAIDAVEPAKPSTQSPVQSSKDAPD